MWLGDKMHTVPLQHFCDSFTLIFACIIICCEKVRQYLVVLCIQLIAGWLQMHFQTVCHTRDPCLNGSVLKCLCTVQYSHVRCMLSLRIAELLISSWPSLTLFMVVDVCAVQKTCNQLLHHRRTSQLRELYRERLAVSGLAVVYEIWYALRHCDSVIGSTPREGKAVGWYNALIVNRRLSQSSFSPAGPTASCIVFLPGLVNYPGRLSLSIMLHVGTAALHSA